LWTLTVPTETAGPPARLHSTPTTDLGVVLSGRVVLELEDGSRAQLAAGDAFVQAGTAHRWRNPHPADAVLAVVVLGREPSSSF
jgi:quercetin dioxygenase-like cupin family protein